MIKFSKSDLPVAHSMIKASRDVRPSRDGYHPFRKYIYLWAAFNNIYTAISYISGRHVTTPTDNNGVPILSRNGNVLVSRYDINISERRQIDLAFSEFDDDLKHNLIVHNSTVYFLERIPFWRGQPIENDALGQRVNGVINVNYTTRPDYPVWSPIDISFYHQYRSIHNNVNRDFLSKQVVSVLYTVRNNLFHGGKQFDDGKDMDVVSNAINLLWIIVRSFTY